MWPRRQVTLVHGDVDAAAEDFARGEQIPPNFGIELAIVHRG